MSQETLLSLKQAATELNVSEATIRNWIKLELIMPFDKRKNIITRNEVIRIKNQIFSGEISKLRTRANKLNCSSSFLPNEYIPGQLSDIVLGINKVCRKAELSVSDSMFYSTLLILLQKKEVTIATENSSNLTIFNFKRKNVEHIMLEWEKELATGYNDSIIKQLFDNVNINEVYFDYDILGALYQVIMSEGNKSLKGSYFTPSSIIDDIISKYYKENDKILDPCCGSGQFLLRFAKHNKCFYNQLFGIDADKICVRLASINLLLCYDAADFTPHIYHLNTLQDIDPNSIFDEYNFLYDAFDIVATNPPWGSVINRYEYMAKFPQISSGESYSYFLVVSHLFVKQGGIISFILPESILNIHIHKDIRKFILEHFNIIQITELGKVFSGVFTKVYRFDLKKENPHPEHLIKIQRDTLRFKQRQSFYKENSDYMFNIQNQDDVSALIHKVYAKKHITLKNNADWALGIVTGNNNKYISKEKKDRYEEIYRGKDVFPLFLGKAKEYILFQPEAFQQVAPEWKYRAKEKLIYRFISNKLIFAYDDQQVLTLNSANICIPKFSGIIMQTIAALFNSRIYNFLFSFTCNTHKVLRSDLEKLPIPLDFLDITNDIHKITREIFSGYYSLEIMDNYLFRYFEITEEQTKIIQNYRKN